ncbi:hypothetical protein F52700_2472 [Fusarium sp. NRRL 52700]|nr:hypothetical protein F52700_2472 [Fusarium sp. NRRL 52700]
MSELASLDPVAMKDFIASVFLDDEEAERARFAHIKLPLFRDPQTPWIKAVAQAFADAFGNISEKLLFVMTDNEWQMDPAPLSSMELPVSADKITFQGLLEYLRHSFSRFTTNVGYRWKQGTWNDSILPRDAIIILHMDPSLQADCAFALIGTIQWAIDIEFWAISNIRILTMSTSDHHDHISQLICLRRPGHTVPFLDLSYESDRPWVTHISESSDDDGIVSDICRVVSSDLATSHLIISFEDSVTIREKLSELLANIKESNALKMRTVLTKVDTLFGIFQPPRPDAVVLLNIPGDIPLLPPVFYGYDNVHVIVSDRLPSRDAWHHKSRHIVDFRRYSSNQERWAQLWWLEQPAEQRYLYSNRVHIEDFLENGFRRHHRIEDDQLGGFIAGVYDAKDWGIDCPQTIECFIPNGARVPEMKKRLEDQLILANDAFALESLEAKAFRAILPAVQYNYHLALFVAADCDATVRLLKLQLAALLVVRIADTVVMESDGLLEMMTDEENYNKMLDYCMGSVRCMANQGSLWLALALWTSQVLLVDSNLRQERIPHLEGLARMFEGLLAEPYNQTKEAQELSKTMARILQKQDVSVLTISTRDEMTIELNEDQQFMM